MILHSLLSKAQIHWILGFVHGSIFYMKNLVATLSHVTRLKFKLYTEEIPTNWFVDLVCMNPSN